MLQGWAYQVRDPQLGHSGDSDCFLGQPRGLEKGASRPNCLWRLSRWTGIQAESTGKDYYISD